MLVDLTPEQEACLSWKTAQHSDGTDAVKVLQSRLDAVRDEYIAAIRREMPATKEDVIAALDDPAKLEAAKVALGL
jgi:hypothetical protein